jgi:transposase
MGLAGLESKSESEELEPVVSAEAKPSSRKPGHGRNRLPQNIEERTVYIDPPEVLADPEGYREIGSEKSEQLDIVPTKLVKIVTIRRKYVSRKDIDAAVLIAPPPAMPIDKGLPTARLLAWVAVSKLPLYRQAKAYRRLGCEVSRKTMSDWMQAVEFWLSGIYELMLARLLEGNYLQADDGTRSV